MITKRLYLFVGFPGSGKTTVARMIADATGAIHLWADQERQQMFGKPTLSSEESDKLYERLNLRAAELLASGQSVIYDTNFNFRKDRDQLRALANANNAEAIIIWMTTPAELAKYRATEQSIGVDTRIWGNMPIHVFERISQNLQPPSADEQPIIFDGTDLNPTIVLNQLDIPIPGQ